jgi:hypothetical protein
MTDTSTPEKPPRRRVYLDTETTGLHPDAQAFELAWLPADQETSQIRTLILPHTLHGADPVALRINGYRERGISRMGFANDMQVDHLREELTDANLVIANPVFDVPHLMKLLGFQVWHYRITDIESYAQAILGTVNPPGMNEIFLQLAAMGYNIPEPDHTAKGDVAALAAVDTALRHRGDQMRLFLKEQELSEIPLAKREGFR